MQSDKTAFTEIPNSWFILQYMQKISLVNYGICQAFMIEFFSENNKRFLADNFFRNKISSENVLQGPIYVSESPEYLQFI